MKKLKALVALCCSALVACQGGGSNDAPMVPVAAVQTRLFPSDGEILAKTYDPLFQVPDNFLVDERAGTLQSISVHHVKNDSGDYELCSDDFTQALAWETTDNENAPVPGAFTGSVETDKYFEFMRDLVSGNGIGNVTNPTSTGFARVFKCTYVNRDGVDRHSRDGDAGTLNTAELTTDVIRDFTEYMWQFTFFWPASKTVLESFTAETTSAFQHTLLLSLLTSRGADQCDLIEVVDWIFSVDKDSGQITKEFMPIYELEAKLDNNGIPTTCNN